MGGSTPVPQKIRIQVWLETVPVLLRILNVEKVSILSHSAGTLYALNTIYHLRDILDPEAPYVALIGQSHPEYTIFLRTTTTASHKTIMNSLG